MLDGRDADNLGYVNSVDEAFKLIAEFETGSTTKFSCFKANKAGMYIYINIMRGKKGRNYISRQACFVNRFTLQGFNERIFM